MKNNWWLSELGIPTKGALVEKIRSIVARTVRIVATDDTEFMRKVFSHHYEWIDKQGCVRRTRSATCPGGAGHE